MNNDKLDEILLETSAPPVKILNEVTPWKKSIKRVVIGLVLTTITINIHSLDYILTSIGCVLLLFGYRTLQHENKWFKASFNVTIIKGAYLFLCLILNSTIYQFYFSNSVLSIVLKIFNLSLQLLLYIFLWKAFLSVQEKAELPAKTKTTAALIVFYIVLCVFALIELQGIFVLVILMIYGCIIRSLYKLSNELNESGYTIITKPFKFSEKRIISVISVILVIGLLFGYTFFDSYKMKWVKKIYTDNKEIQSVKADLINKGFPEYVLDDLKDEDILSCENAVKIVSDKNEYPINNGNVILKEYDNSVAYETVYDKKKVVFTGVAVLVNDNVNSNGKEEWVVFHHFLWQEVTRFYGTEAIKLMPAHYNEYRGWLPNSEITGQLLYDCDGITYTSEYYSIEDKTVKSKSSGIMVEKSNYKDTYASFSLPNEGEKHRGYLTYRTIGNTDEYIFDSWINYYHQQSKLQYPVMTAEQYGAKYSFSPYELTFKLIQDALQF